MTVVHERSPVTPASPSSSTARVAVVIPCYRQAEFLPAAVASVCAQTYEDLEVVIVDDGSPDDTAAVAERLATAYPERTIRLLRQLNQGLPASRNNGIASTSSEFVLTLDADDLIEPTFVEDCIRVLDARPDVSIAYGRQRYFGELNEFPAMPEYDLGLLTRRCLFPCAALYRRRAWTDVGGYNEELKSYEDWDFWLGCGERGHYGLHVPHVLFYYRRRSGSMVSYARRHDSQLKARLVLNHSVLFSDGQAAWARGVIAGEVAANAIDVQDIIPLVGEMAVLPARSGGAFEGARRFATLAIAEEILERPRLLAAYGAVFGGQDDASLIITGAQEQIERLGLLVDELGLGDSDAADLIGAIDDGSPSSLIAAATRVDALLSARPVLLPVQVPRFDDSRASDLRRLAG